MAAATASTQKTPEAAPAASASATSASTSAPAAAWNATFAGLIGNEFVNAKGAKLTAADLKGKTIGIYFSAHWCPPCRQFTPELVKTYNTLKAAGKQFEIVFASSDKNPAQFAEYFAAMPWTALPFAERQRKEKLSQHYEVESIPTLVIVDGNTGETITRNGRMRVAADPAGKEYPWYPLPSKELNAFSAQDINDVAALIAFLDTADSKTADAVSKAVATVAAEVYAGFKTDKRDPDLNFLLGLKHPIVTAVKQFVAPPTGAAIVLLDVPKGVKYVLNKAAGEVTEAVVRDFVANYRAGKLEKIALPPPPVDDNDF